MNMIVDEIGRERERGSSSEPLRFLLCPHPGEARRTCWSRCRALCYLQWVCQMKCKKIEADLLNTYCMKRCELGTNKEKPSVSQSVAVMCGRESRMLRRYVALHSIVAPTVQPIHHNKTNLSLLPGQTVTRLIQNVSQQHVSSNSFFFI